MSIRKRLLFVLVALILLALAGTGFAADRDPFVIPPLTAPVTTALRIDGADISVLKIGTPGNLLSESSEKVIVSGGKIAITIERDGVVCGKEFLTKTGTFALDTKDIIAASLKPGTIKARSLKPGMPARLVFKNYER